MRRLGTYFDPVVDQTWIKLHSCKHARGSLLWCSVNFLLAFLIYVEIKYNTIGSSLDFTHPVLWYTECIFLLVFTLNGLTNVAAYVRMFFSTKYVEVTQEQKKLLAINDTDTGFRLSPKKSPSSSTTGSLVFSSTTPTGQASFSKTPSPSHSGGRLTPTNVGSITASPLNFSNLSQSYSPYSSSISFDKYHSISPNMSYSHQSMLPSPNVSGYNSSPHLSVIAGTSHSPSMLGSHDTSGLRSRSSLPSSLRNSPASSSFDRIADMQSLSNYLKEQEEKEIKSALSSPDMSSSAGSSFWNYGRSAMDYTHVLRKYMYQLASRSPHSPTARNNDKDQLSPFGADDVWIKRNVTEDDLYLWIERLRKWICQTVVSRVAREIDEVNTRLRRIGSEDTEIGEVGVSTLKQLALTKGTHVPTLNALVPYLDFSSNQEYLVRRIKDLGKDGCMSEFMWNGGGHYGKAWGEHLPTDAALVMHLLCTYLDSRLPAQPKYPDGKTFTTQHFIKVPDKPNLEKEDNLYIYQSQINPPVFQVVIGKTIHSLPKGRNNFFQAVLLFLHHIKTKDHGMLGRVNLGLSGINVLWILD